MNALRAFKVGTPVTAMITLVCAMAGWTWLAVWAALLCGFGAGALLATWLTVGMFREAGVLDVLLDAVEQHNRRRGRRR